MSGERQKRQLVTSEQLEAWAEILLEHSLGGILPEDRVMLKGEAVCWPLLEVLERRVAAAGARPDVFLVAPNNERGRAYSAAVARHAAGDLEAPAWQLERYDAMTKYVEVLGAADPSRYAGLSPQQAQRLSSAESPLVAKRLARPWVLTLYPTSGFAAMEGLSLNEYTAVVVAAATADPRPLLAGEQRLAPLFESGDEVRVCTATPDGRELELTLDISPGRPVLSHGRRNVPDGEIFTSPDARRTEGGIFLDLPVHYGGRELRGIELQFSGGRVIEARAQTGQDALDAILGTDEGARRLGEVALGMNPELERVLKHPLFVEKVGGTLHVALGASYEECYVVDPASPAGRQRVHELEREGVLNRSAQHVDLVADFRPGGCGRAVTIDGVALGVRGRVWQVENEEDA